MAFLIGISLVLSILLHVQHSAVAVTPPSPINKITIDPITRQFVDEYGRVRIFHGVNAVYKIDPWIPEATGFDSNNTLSDIDAGILNSDGFNIVRLGVMWPGLEPGKPGVYSKTYLDRVAVIVELLAERGIYVILDMHQDLWHRKYCGEGVPDWVQAECAKYEPAGTKPFPQPVVDATYPVDSNGNPDLDSCLSTGFASYYLTNEVSAAFQCLYDNHANLWDALGNFWLQVATKFKSYKSVIGYEILNEPWIGNIYEHPGDAIPGRTEKNFLQPMYQHVHSYIRQVDTEKVIFFEGLTIDYFPSGFTETPGGSAFNDRQALAYHIYCVPDPSKVEALLCAGIDDFFFDMRKKDGERLGVATIMTEFGATVPGSKTSAFNLLTLSDQSDKHQQSWMYWQYKYYQDLTTCTPSGESLYKNDGTDAVEKLEILTRPYPEATAGDIQSYKFNQENHHFSFLYTVGDNTHAASVGDSRTDRETIIRVNAKLHYPNGVHIRIEEASGADSSLVVLPSVHWRCQNTTSNAIILTHSDDTAVGTNVSLTVRPCSSDDTDKLRCSCTFV